MEEIVIREQYSLIQQQRLSLRQHGIFFLSNCILYFEVY